MKRETPLQRIIRLWRHELRKQGTHHGIKIRFLREEGIDSGARRREFFAEVVPAKGNTLFPSGTAIDSTFHVQNGDFQASGDCCQPCCQRRTTPFLPGLKSI